MTMNTVTARRKGDPQLSVEGKTLVFHHVCYQIVASRCQLPDPGFQILATRSRLPNSGFHILATRFLAARNWLPNPGYQILDGWESP